MGVDEDIRKGGLGELVRDMVEFGKGQRGLCVHLEVCGDEEEAVRNDDSHGCPRVSHVTFPVPVRSLEPDPHLAYLDLVFHMVLFAADTRHDTLVEEVGRMREICKQVGETPVEMLCKLARRVGAEEQTVQALKKEAERYWENEEEGSGASSFEDFLRGGEVDGENASLNQDANDHSGSIIALRNGDHDPFAALEELVQNKYETQRRYMREFIERYESVDGFLVLHEKKIYDIMVAEDEQLENIRKD